MLPSLVRLTYGSQPTFIGQVLQFELSVRLSLRFLCSQLAATAALRAKAAIAK